MSKILTSESYRRFKRFVSLSWWESPECDWLRRAIGAFNSHFWRDHDPDSIMLASWRSDPLDGRIRLETSFRLGLSPWAYNFTTMTRFRIHPAANFNDFDFGDPIPATEHYP